MKIVFFGTSQFAAQVLHALLGSKKHSVAAVVTKQDQPQGRNLILSPPPVKKELERLECTIPILQPLKCSTEENAKLLQSFNADIFVVVAYGEILRENILTIPRYGCINIHASLLPKFRGAAPIHRAIMQGEAESGICIIQMVRQMDAGDILKQKKTPITADMTFGELESKLCLLGIEGLFETLDDFERSTVVRVAQDHSNATIASKIESAECHIDWNCSAMHIHNLVRGTYPYPAAWCYISIKGSKKRVKITKTHCIDQEHSLAVGTIVSQKESLCIACQKGYIQIDRLQPEGKREMDVKEFLRGVSLETLSLIP